jgi:large subunit ribosomal protein L22
VAEREGPPQVRAQAKWVRTAPRKARLVVDHIRGRTVPEARTILAFTPRAVARDVEKVLRSAVANAESAHGLVGDELVVASAVVDEGPMLKRGRARARGRYARIFKRTCHITLTLTEDPRATTRRRRRAAAPAVAEETPASAENEAEAAERPNRAARRQARAEQTEEVTA